jgi:hypothetical protein
MVTQYNGKDMTSFANHFAQLIQTGKKQPNASGEYEVSHADMENWKDSISKVQKVRAKFRCTNVDTNDVPGDSQNIHMEVVIDGSPENKVFSEYTPYGQFNIGIDKSAPALQLFEEGREYFIDITKTPLG